MPRQIKPGVMPIEELRRQWYEAWGLQPHARIGRTMLEKSLVYKKRELAGLGMTAEQLKRLEQLIKTYRRNPNCFDTAQVSLKPGTRLVRVWNGERHSVLVQPDGFEFNGRHYDNLSRIATEITGSKWNGWVFFGLKRKESSQ